MGTNSPVETEQDFLAAYDANEYPHPSLSVDVAILSLDLNSKPTGATRFQVVMVQRQQHPAHGKWALPGAFVGMDESLDSAAVRALVSKTGIPKISVQKDVFLEQLFTFGEPKRDPRTRVVTVAYYALVDHRLLTKMLPQVSEQDQFDEIASPVKLLALDVPWSDEQGGVVHVLSMEGNTLPVAFDHSSILGLAVKRLRGKLNYAEVGFELLPKFFTLRQLQLVHETVLGRQLNKDSFRRRMLATGRVIASGKLEEAVGHRPAELYQFKPKRG